MDGLPRNFRGSDTPPTRSYGAAAPFAGAVYMGLSPEEMDAHQPKTFTTAEVARMRADKERKDAGFLPATTEQRTGFNLSARVAGWIKRLGLPRLGV